MQTVGHYTLRNFCSQLLYLLVRFILTVNSLIFLCSKSNAFGSQTSAITMEAIKRFFLGFFPSLRATEDDQPKYEFPGTIEEFGYVFNDQGQLVSKVDMNGRFVFSVKEDDRNYNQQHYDALGEAITDYLYDLMVTNLKLEKVYLPVGGKKEPLSFIFQSPDALTADKLMVLIHGSGVVRAGQWSRKLIINENIDEGSQFPYIRRAMADGYGIIVMNTNLNKAMVNGKLTDIRENNTPEKHGLYVWSHIITRAAAKNIVVVAHSYGGIVLCNILEKHLSDFQERVFCVVFTDSVHSADRSLWAKPAKEFLKERAVNFASTYVPINFIMQSSSPDDVMSVSAGTKEHERTSSACIESAFKFIRDNYETWSKDRTMAPRTDFKPLPDDLSMYSPAKEWEKRTGEAVARRKEEEEELKRKSAEQEVMATDPKTVADQGYVQQQDDDQQQQMQQQLQLQPLPHQQVEQRNADQKNEEVEVAEDAMEANLENDNKLREDGKDSETSQSLELTAHPPIRQEDVQGKSDEAVQEKADEGEQEKSEDIKPVADANDAEYKSKDIEEKTVDSEKADGDNIKTEEPFICTENTDGNKSKAEEACTDEADGDKAKPEYGEKAHAPDGTTAQTEEPCTENLAGEKALEQTSVGEEICTVQGASDGVCASQKSEATPVDFAEEFRMDIVCKGKSTEEAEAERDDDGTTVMTVQSGDEH